jgi:hypothetical protein
VVARLVHTKCSDQGHYPFYNWQLLRRFRYNNAGFERDESVDPTRLSLLTADPTITLLYDILRGFDMEERDLSALYCTPAQGRVHQRHSHPRRRGTGEAGGHTS